MQTTALKLLWKGPRFLRRWSRRWYPRRSLQGQFAKLSLFKLDKLSSILPVRTSRMSVIGRLHLFSYLQAMLFQIVTWSMTSRRESDEKDTRDQRQEVRRHREAHWQLTFTWYTEMEEKWLDLTRLEMRSLPHQRVCPSQIPESSVQLMSCFDDH